MTSQTPPLHSDFGDLRVDPGAAHISARPELFNLVNVIAFGGDAQRHPHVPSVLGRVGSVVCWESTGAADALPFWNTNPTSDVYLYLVHGQVRVEFKAVEGTTSFGHYLARTGDLMLLPKGIAHRTFSVDGRRRISLEILEYDDRWDDLERYSALEPDRSLALDGLTFRPEAGDTEVHLGEDRVVTSTSFLVRGLRALVAYGGHLGHNEFEGGFVIADDPDGLRFKVGASEVRCARESSLALFLGVIAAIDRLPGDSLEGADEH